MRKMKSKKNDTNYIFMILSLAIIVFLATLLIYRIANNNKVSSIRKKLNTKYDNVSCINKSCDGIMVLKEGKNNKNDIRIYNSKGNLEIKYSEKQSKKIKTPYALKKEYFLKSISDKNGKNTKYSINDKNGKELYSSSNKLTALSDNLILMEEKDNIDYIYTLISKDGKELHSNITEIENYFNNKYIYVKIGENSFILNKEGKKVLENYKVEEKISNEDDALYLIVKDNKEDIYYYFDINNNKIVGEGFYSYKINKDNSITVTRKENDTINSYIINSKGKQKRIDNTLSISNLVNDIRSKIDNKKYYLYTESIVDLKQKTVLVDDLDSRSIGTLNFTTKEYKKIYDYNSDNFHSDINVLDSLVDDTYIQISCSKNSCDNNKMIIYNLTKDSEIFKNEDNNKVIQNYVQFENGYKVFKYSYSSDNKDYKGKYVLYDDKNNEIFISNNEINVIDSKVVLGDLKNEELILYLSSKKKRLNDDKNLAKKLNMKSNYFYEYKDNNKDIIIDKYGKKIFYSENGRLEYNNENIFAINDKKIKIYNIKLKKTSSYKFEKNETLNDMLNKEIKPFKGALFINNIEDNYIKVVNSNGKVIKTIKDVSIKSVEITEKRAYIISKKIINGKTKFGLYIVK